MENPWVRVPTEKPFVLEEDRTSVETFNKRVGPDSNRFLQIDKLLPEPFIGDPNAPVLLLSNNPGFGDGWQERAKPPIAERARDNLHHRPSGYPLYYLAPDGQTNRRWWQRKLKHLIKRFSAEVVSRSVTNVVYFPYPSKRYGHDGIVLPSQEYGFHLVRQAIRRDAIIVLMRRDQRWLDAIPELNSYKRRFQVLNTQNPCVGPNCPGFDQIVKAIEDSRTGKH